MAKQNLGRVAMVSKGEYSSATSYERLDIVRKSCDGIKRRIFISN